MMNDRIINLLRAYGLGIFYLAVALPVRSLADSAQRPACGHICFAQYMFEGTCHKPFAGAKLYYGRVLGVSFECPDTILHIQTQDRELPSAIEIRLAGCKKFAGKVGDPVQFAVERPSSEVRRYPLACDLR